MKKKSRSFFLSTQFPRRPNGPLIHWMTSGLGVTPHNLAKSNPIKSLGSASISNFFLHPHLFSSRVYSSLFHSSNGRGRRRRKQRRHSQDDEPRRTENNVHFLIRTADRVTPFPCLYALFASFSATANGK